MSSRLYKKKFRPYEKQVIIDQEYHWYLLRIRQNYRDIYDFLIEQRQLYFEQLRLFSDLLTSNQISLIRQEIKQIDLQIPTIGARVCHYTTEIRKETQDLENRTLYLA